MEHVPSNNLQWIEVNRSAYLHNLDTFRKLLHPGCRLMVVVKANAYGHGLELVGLLAAEAGVDALGVNHFEEGTALRARGIKLPVMILGYTPLDGMKAVVDLGLEPVLYNRESILRLHEEAKQAKRRAGFHLKLETGTHRQGVTETELEGLTQLILRCDQLDLLGCSMHFANIEDTTDHSYARQQLETLRRMIARLESLLGRRPSVHAACSAATILMDETHFDLVRVGISSYGLWPSKETFLASVLMKQNPPVLKPVMTWKTRVAQIKDIPADSYVGYGCSYRTTHPMRLAVLPVGYADGYDRRLSNQGHVLVCGKRAPVVGRICMNMVMVDVTHVPGVALEDEVVLLGVQGRERLTADELAALCHTINYEIVSRIGAHIPRVLVG